MTNYEDNDLDTRFLVLDSYMNFKSNSAKTNEILGEIKGLIDSNQFWDSYELENYIDPMSRTSALRTRVLQYYHTQITAPEKEKIHELANKLQFESRIRPENGKIISRFLSDALKYYNKEFKSAIEKVEQFEIFSQEADKFKMKLLRYDHNFLKTIEQIDNEYDQMITEDYEYVVNVELYVQKELCKFGQEAKEIDEVELAQRIRRSYYSRIKKSKIVDPRSINYNQTSYVKKAELVYEEPFAIQPVISDKYKYKDIPFVLSESSSQEKEKQSDYESEEKILYKSNSKNNNNNNGHKSYYNNRNSNKYYRKNYYNKPYNNHQRRQLQYSDNNDYYVNSVNINKKNIDRWSD